MSSKNHRLPWERLDWLPAASSWMISSLESHGISLTGPIEEFQSRPWSILLRAPAGDRVFYLKACSPQLQHEPALTQALSGWHPECIPPVIALDAERAWMILPDSGPTLRSQFQSGAGIALWHKILPLYASLQKETAQHSSELLELGILDRRLANLPDHYFDLLEDLPMLRVGKEDGLNESEFEQLKQDQEQFQVMCRELAAFDIPETLQHDDFHDGNICCQDGKTLFIDWGETCLAHPFFSMVVGLNGIAYRFDLQPEDHELAVLRDAYLEPWTDEFTRSDLLAAFNLAMQVGAVNRALTWHRVVKSLPSKWQKQNADAVPGWLQEYLERRQRYSKG